MATLVTRSTTQTDGTAAKGSELTHAEVDANFINLNDDKVEVSGAIVFAAKAGEALTKGDVVYVSGVSGNEPVVSRADADDASKMPAFGLAEADANLNAAVNVVTFGTLYDLDTSAFSAGDTVYVSTTAGGLTATKPTGEASLIQNMGKVIRSHASAGSIKVGGAGRSNDTPNLDDGNVFIGNASNQAETRALVEADISDFGTYIGLTDLSVTTNAVGTAALSYNNTSGVFSYTPPDLSSYLTSYTETDPVVGAVSGIVKADGAGNISAAVAGTDYLASYTETDTLDSVTGRGATTSNAVTVGNLTSTGIDDNATSTAITIDSSQNVGIGTSEPQAKLDLYGASSPPTYTGNIRVAGGSATTKGGIEFIATSYGSGYGWRVDAPDEGSGNTPIIFRSRSNSAAWTERMRLNASGDLGIGATPEARLDVRNSSGGAALTLEGSGGVTGGINSGTGTAGTFISCQDTATLGLSFGFHGSRGNNYFTDTSIKMVLDTSGNLLVGTTTANQRLTVEGANSSEGISVKNTSTVTLYNQALISLEYGTSRAGAGCYKNSNNTNPAGYIQLSDGNSSNFFFYHGAGVWRTSQTAGHIGTTTGTVVGSQTSDERIKTIESGFEYGLDSVMALTPIAYSFNDEQERRLGFGAQTTQAVVPEAVYDTGECIDGYDSCEENQMVQTARSSNTKLAMEYVQLIPVLTKAIQEQQAMIETLQAQVAELQGAN
jgi:hypothetical protein